MGRSIYAVVVIGLVLAIVLKFALRSNDPEPGDLSEWIAFPGTTWSVLTPEEAGLDPALWERYRQAMQAGMGPASALGEEHPDDQSFPIGDPRRHRWGSCLAFHGHLIGREDPDNPGRRIVESCWGNPDYRFQSASVGKALVRMALQIAIDHQLVSVDDHIATVWPVEARGELRGRPIDCGDRSTLGNILRMRGGYYVSNGHSDGCDNSLCTDDSYRYSRGGYWRASQALTYVFTNAWGMGIQDTFRPTSWMRSASRKAHGRCSRANS